MYFDISTQPNRQRNIGMNTRNNGFQEKLNNFFSEDNAFMTKKNWTSLFTRLDINSYKRHFEPILVEIAQNQGALLLY